MADFVLQARLLQASIDASCAGRVATLSYEGRPLLVGPDIHRDNWGSTFWTSPQADWGWPPPAEIDHAPFDVLSTEPLQLRGPAGSLGPTRVRLSKTFVPRVEQDALDILYTLENVGHQPLKVAGWEITRVAGGGLTFFPTGETEISPIEPHGLLVLHREAGHSFYHHTHFILGTSIKVNADGQEGYLAHVTAPGADGRRLLFLKLYADTSSEQQAPGEGEVEIFANQDGRYVEVEVQGSYDTVPPGQSLELRVRWLVRAVPPDVAVYPGSLTLIEFTRALARSVR